MRPRRIIDQVDPTITTNAPTDEATAAATRGPAPNTAEPCGSSSEVRLPLARWSARGPVKGAAITTPAANVQASTVTTVMRSATRRSASR